jgi:2',3'-cyclic-nucleotide 2'-phosphodiesterase (5'-nucleotidase family)
MGGITNHTFRSGSAEPVGGVARFQTVVKEYRHSPCYADQPSLLTLFSGDAFNPSLESSVTKGRHMVPFLNAVGTDIACVGVRMAPFTSFLADIY